MIIVIQSEMRIMFDLSGVVSFGASVCGSSIPGVFTKIQSYLPWIKSEIEKLKQNRFRRN